MDLAFALCDYRKRVATTGRWRVEVNLVVPSFKLPSTEVVVLEVRVALLGKAESLRRCLPTAYVGEKRAQVCLHEPCSLHADLPRT